MNHKQGNSLLGNKLKSLDQKGQLNWSWSFLVAGIGFLFSVLYWILLDEVRLKINTPVLAAGANAVNMGTLDALWGFAPIIMLFSFALFTWLVADATRGGEQV